MTKTRASLATLGAVLALFLVGAAGCPPQPPLVKRAGSSCLASQKGKSAVDDQGRELVCTRGGDGKYRWLMPDS